MDTIISDAIMFILVALFFIAIWLLYRVEQRLPEKQREALNHFVEIAVKDVEQELGNAPSDQKKTTAISIVEQLFMEFKMPIPSEKIISMAIEALIWEISNVGKNSGIKQRRDQQSISAWSNRLKRNQSANLTNDLRE